MNEESALLAAVAANPDEDTPRLIFADWLDEYAADLPDPDAARLRAEFIRIQCEIKRLEDRTSTQLQEYAALYRRQADFLSRRREGLLGPIGAVVGELDVVFDRGFPVELRLDPPRLLAHAAAVAAMIPRPRVTLADSAAFLADLCNDPVALALVVEASAQSPRRAEPTTLGVEEVERFFADSPEWSRLEELALEECRIGDEGLKRLAGSRRLPALTRLDLSGNEVSDEGVLALVASDLWPRLEYLVLGANPIGDEGAEALAGAPPTRIAYLNVKFTAVGRAGQQRLLRRKGWKVDLF